MSPHLRARRPTESDITTRSPGKKVPWDNLALRERIAGLEVIHRSVTSELHSAARLATEGHGTAAIPAAPRWDPRVARRPWWKRFSNGLSPAGAG